MGDDLDEILALVTDDEESVPAAGAAKLRELKNGTTSLPELQWLQLLMILSPSTGFAFWVPRNSPLLPLLLLPLSTCWPEVAEHLATRFKYQVSDKFDLYLINMEY